MRTIRIKAYKFDELSDEAKETVINRLWTINVEDDWWGMTFDEAASLGLKITGFDLDRNQHAEGKFILSACEVAQNIFNEHGENCNTYKTAQEFMEDWQPVFNSYMDESDAAYESSESENKMLELEDEFLNYLLEDYANLLQEEYNYLISKEAIIETIQANNYEFTKDGKLI